MGHLCGSCCAKRARARLASWLLASVIALSSACSGDDDDESALQGDAGVDAGANEVSSPSPQMPPGNPMNIGSSCRPTGVWTTKTVTLDEAKAMQEAYDGGLEHSVEPFEGTISAPIRWADADSETSIEIELHATGRVFWSSWTRFGDGVDAGAQLGPACPEPTDLDEAWVYPEVEVQVAIADGSVAGTFRSALSDGPVSTGYPSASVSTDAAGFDGSVELATADSPLVALGLELLRGDAEYGDRVLFYVDVQASDSASDVPGGRRLLAFPVDGCSTQAYARTSCSSDYSQSHFDADRCCTVIRR